jgi:two-component system sensor histidine kinase/response regulator
VAMGLLTRLGFDPDVVANGQEAVEAVGAGEYAVVLMDCNMPVMDGFEATAAIRQDEAGDRHLPIVAMTAGALVGDRERCLAAGMDDYVSKPVKLSELDRVLSRWRPAVEPVPWLDVIDGDQLESLRALDGGDGTFLSALVDSFLTSSTGALRALAEAAEAGDATALAAEAHRFKGEAATLGASALAAVCGQLEKLGDPVDRPAARTLVARAEREMGRVREMLRDALGGAQVS